MSFAHPESRPSGSQTRSFDILRQPVGARRCAKPWCTTRNPVVAQKPMEF